MLCAAPAVRLRSMRLAWPTLPLQAVVLVLIQAAMLLLWLQNAFKHYMRTRDYCTTGRHVIHMCLQGGRGLVADGQPLSASRCDLLGSRAAGTRTTSCQRGLPG